MKNTARYLICICSVIAFGLALAKPPQEITFPMQNQGKTSPQPRPIKIRTVVAKPRPQVVVTFYPGSLRTNIARIAKAHHWRRIIWLPSDDYNWVGQVTVRANSVPDAFRQVLTNYPLQAVFYTRNRVLVIQPRTLR